MAKVIKKTKLRDWGVIKHIQKKGVISINVSLTNYDERMEYPSSETILEIERKNQLKQIFKAFNPSIL